MTYLLAVLIIAVTFGIVIMMILGTIHLLTFAYDEVVRPIEHWRRKRRSDYQQRIYDASRNRRS